MRIWSLCFWPCSRESFRRRGSSIRAIDRTLEAVCLKAMALEPGDRYASPARLADDIERWMADDPVTAVPDGWARRLARWSRRHRSATRAAAASLVVIATVATLAAAGDRPRASSNR